MKHTGLILILALGVFGILNTEMGMVGILPFVAGRYSIDIVQAGLLVSLFALGVAIAGPTMPLLCSRFNRKKVMLFVLGLFTVCNVLSVIAPTFNIMLAARIIPAFFHPVYCALAFSVAAESVAKEKAPLAVARINMGVAAGMVVGVPISNFLATTFGLAASLSFFALVTGTMFLLTLFFVPDMPASGVKSYGEQLRVLRRPSVWATILAIIFVNGSIFGVFSYLADYLSQGVGVAAALISLLLFVYGLSNLGGSWLGGEFLAKKPLATVRIFPLFVIALYLFLLADQTPSLLLLVPLLVIWGILGGIDSNITQFWMSRAIPDAPDFANGLFLAAANIGCMTGAAFGGFFIRSLGISYVVLAGLIFAAIAFVLFNGQIFSEKNTAAIHAPAGQ